MSVWLHEGGRLERIHLLTQQEETSAFNYPSLMLVNYDNQYYIQPVVRNAVRDLQEVAIIDEREVESISSCPRNRDDEKMVDQLVVSTCMIVAT